MEYIDPELEELMRSNLKVSKENNKLLHKIWKDVRYRRFIKFFYWVIIIGLSLGSYYYAQPYIEKAIGIYTSINQKVQTTGNTLNMVNKEAKTGLDAGVQTLNNVKDVVGGLIEKITN